MRMFEEEAEHLARGVGPPWIGVGAGGAAARPGMARSVDDPPLENRHPARVGVEDPAVGVPAGNLAALHSRRQADDLGRGRLRDDLFAVAGMHRGVLVAVEHDRRNDSPGLPRAIRTAPGSDRAPAHGGKCRWQVAGSAAGKARMNADRGVEIGIGRSHYRRGGPAGRKPRHVNAPGIDRVVAHDLTGDARDQRGLAPAAPLVLRPEPVPALRGVGGSRLRRIDDEAALLLGERVHARAGGEVVGRLGTAVQHDDQG